MTRTVRILLSAILLLIVLAVPAFANTAVRVVTGITSVSLGLTAGVNESYALNARLSDGSAADGMTYHSTNESVVTVSEDGVLTAHMFGAARVIVGCPQAKSATVTVKVSKIRAKSLKLNKSKATLTAHRSGLQLIGTVKPATVDTDAVSWTSSVPSVATVDETGYVTPLKAGKTVITCRTTDGSGLKRKCTVTVKALVPSSVAVTPESVSIAPNSTCQLTAEVAPADADNKNVIWCCSNKNVAAVTSTGLVRGIKSGNATITCKTKSGGKIAKIKVTVGFADSNINVCLIAQENYRGEGLHLPGTIQDAENLKAFFEDMQIGQKSLTVKQHNDLTAGSIINTLNSLAAGTGENDVTILYYTGHGMDSSTSKELRGALVGVDYTGTRGYVTVDTVKSCLDKIPGTVVVILDSCLSGQYITAKTTKVIPATEAQIKAYQEAVIGAFAKSASVLSKGNESLISTSTKSKYKILTACSPLQESYMISTEEDEHVYQSIFTMYLCDSFFFMNKSDKNHNKLISLNEAFQYVKPRVDTLARSYGGKQTVSVWPAKDPFAIYGRLPN